MLDTKLGQFAKLCQGYEQSYSRGEGGLATDQVGCDPNIPVCCFYGPLAQIQCSHGTSWAAADGLQIRRAGEVAVAAV